jgi:hypothetical protein
LKLFVALWDNAPQEWKLRCKPLPNDRIKVDQWKRDTIKVPKIVLDHLPAWEADLLLILNASTPLTRPSGDFAEGLYLALDGIHTQSQIVDVIRSRIIRIILYCLLDKLGVRQVHPNSEAESEFLGRIGIWERGEKDTKQRRTWAPPGGKIYSFSLEFAPPQECLGSVICMPEDIKSSK